MSNALPARLPEEARDEPADAAGGQPGGAPPLRSLKGPPRPEAVEKARRDEERVLDLAREVAERARAAEQRAVSAERRAAAAEQRREEFEAQIREEVRTA